MKRITAALLIGVAIAAGTLAGVVVSTLKSDRMANGVTIAGVDVTGLTKSDARDRISPMIKGLRSRPLVLRIQGRELQASLPRLGMSPNIEATTNAAFAIGRKGNWLQQFIARAFRNTGGRDVGVNIEFDLDRLDGALDDIGRRVGHRHKDARLRMEHGALVIDPEQPGVKIDVSKAATDIVLAASVMGTQSRPIDLSFTTDKPEVTAKDLRTVDGVLSSYTTRFPAWKRDRTHNIILAAKSLDGTLLKPGELFSFNKLVGPRLKKLGYRDAPIFVNGELEPGTGGGICQVSSTAYNTALLSNFKIVQRDHHAGPVTYVPKGRDATVVYGARDLKFRNTTSSPVYISTTVSGSHVSVTFYGATAEKKDVRIYSSGGKMLGHTTVIVKDYKLKPGARVVQREGRNGYSVRTYRVVMNNGTQVRRELISSDVYRPLSTKIATGQEVVKSSRVAPAGEAD